MEVPVQKVRMAVRWLLAILLAYAIGGTPCYGQSFFVDGALVRDVDYSQNGVGLTAGVELPRTLVLQIEGEVPNWYSLHDAAPGLELNYFSRTVAYGALTGPRVGSGSRMQLAVLGGFSVLLDSLKAHGYYDYLAPGAPSVSHNTYNTHDTDHFLAFTLGLDAPVHLATHLSLVPKLRVHRTIANWRGPNVRRLELAMRWTF
jgi:hypothetical protein